MDIVVGGTTIATIKGQGTAKDTNDLLYGTTLQNAILAAISGGTVTIGDQTFEVSKGEGGDCRLSFKLVGSGSFAGADVSISASDGSVFQRTTVYLDDALKPTVSG